ncbi:glycine zipper 2TM domain-containing protein [Telmatospirillum sp. J64-1]|uniref:glycine zipper 2TM domain-containing protein n=1 Tax=Telmatospirillum sp. J64-1 TaxID=2502183 RepID=UPI00163DBECA|nr:glycine zipper 2TM domain-containing protein [Telmatospirillum sp. J64-1]
MSGKGLGLKLAGATLALTVLASGSAAAGDKRYHEKYEYWDGHCKVEIKRSPGGYKEERKCRPGHAHHQPPRFRHAGNGGPPPWAPAHGYRAKKGPQPHYHVAQPSLPFDFGLGRCNREMLGSILGGATGALAGSQFGKGDGKLVATAGGTLIGVLIGGSIGRSMDGIDHACLGNALEYVPDGTPIRWDGPRGAYHMEPVRTFQVADGRYCREFQTVGTIGGRTERLYGQACRQPDGQWEVLR